MFRKGDTVRLRECPQSVKLNRGRILKDQFGKIVDTHYIFANNVSMSRILWTNGKLTWELNDILEVMNNGKPKTSI